MICSNCKKEGNESLFRPSRGNGTITRPRQCLECYQKKRKEVYSKYYKKNNAERRARWHNDPEYRRKNRASAKRYREHNKEKLAHRQRERRAYQREEIITFYGGKCACCGETRIEFLCIDHISGGGTQERRELGMSKYFTKLSHSAKEGKRLRGYRVLCHNCNQALGCYGYCPHNMEELDREHTR